MVVRRHTCSIHVDTNRWRDGATRIIFFRGCFSDFVEKFGSRETVNVEAHKSRGYLSLSLSPSLMRVIGSSMSIGWRRFLTGTGTDNEEIRPFRSPKYRVH